MPLRPCKHASSNAVTMVHTCCHREQKYRPKYNSRDANLPNNCADESLYYSQPSPSSSLFSTLVLFPNPFGLPRGRVTEDDLARFLRPPGVLEAFLFRPRPLPGGPGVPSSSSLGVLSLVLSASSSASAATLTS